MKICKNCGQQIAGGVKFCPNCGVAIVRTTTDSHKQRWHMSENKVQKPSTCVGIENSNKNVPDKKGSRIQKMILPIGVSILLLCIVGVFLLLGKKSTPSGINPPISASEIKGKDYKTVVIEFQDAGFTNIEIEKIEDLVTGWITKDGEIEQISIDGNSSFSIRDYFSADAKVVINYHTFPDKNEETDTSTDENPANIKTDYDKTDKSVSFSTNDLKTAKNGNSGVFAYTNIRGTYNNYWIIDFDEGYVYSFNDGNGDITCDRLRIDSGDLNSVVIITYHDGDNVWSYGLHFKWKNQPDTLILQDEDGYEYEFVTTNLNQVLEIRDSKTIVDY